MSAGADDDEVDDASLATDADACTDDADDSVAAGRSVVGIVFTAFFEAGTGADDVTTDDADDSMACDSSDDADDSDAATLDTDVTDDSCERATLKTTVVFSPRGTTIACFASKFPRYVRNSMPMTAPHAVDAIMSECCRLCLFKA